MKLLFTILLAAVWMAAFTGCGKTAESGKIPPAFMTEIMDAVEIEPELTAGAVSEEAEREAGHDMPDRQRSAGGITDSGGTPSAREERTAERRQ